MSNVFSGPLFVSRLCLGTERFSTEYQRLLIQPIKKDADNHTLLIRQIKKDADDQTSQSEQAELLSVTGNIFWMKAGESPLIILNINIA